MNTRSVTCVDLVPWPGFLLDTLSLYGLRIWDHPTPVLCSCTWVVCLWLCRSFCSWCDCRRHYMSPDVPLCTWCSAPVIVDVYPVWCRRFQSSIPTPVFFKSTMLSSGGTEIPVVRRHCRSIVFKGLPIISGCSQVRYIQIVSLPLRAICW